MKIKRLALITALLFLPLCALNVFASGAELTAASVEAAPGETVTVPVAVSNNPGFSYLKLRFTYDSEKLLFVGAENGTVSADAFTVSEGALSWDTGKDAEADGTLVKLLFSVKEDAVGAAEVALTVTDCFDYDEQPVRFTVNNGAVVIRTGRRLKGDVDGNGTVEAADARLALRASVGLESFDGDPERFRAADADGDGVIMASDARLILRAGVGLEDLTKYK